MLADKSNIAFEGSMGHAWIPDLDVFASKHPESPPKELTVASFLVHAPYAHPCWNDYMIACVSLREVAEFPSAKICLSGATHEILVIALNPEFPLELDGQPHFLTPINFAGQFIADSDEDAAQQTKQAVMDVVNGLLSPDTDFISMWVARFSDSNIKKY